MKKIILTVSILVVMVIGISSVAFAAGVIQSPAEIVAGLTGKTVDQVTEARQDGTTYGAQAAAAGKLDEFQTSRLEQYKAWLDEAVKNKELTQAEADERYAAMEDRIENCDGTGSGQGGGLGFGRMGRNGGQGNGLGDGTGLGRGRGGCGTGACLTAE